jgi:hypothetical protein
MAECHAAPWAGGTFRQMSCYRDKSPASKQIPCVQALALRAWSNDCFDNIVILDRVFRWRRLWGSLDQFRKEDFKMCENEVGQEVRDSLRDYSRPGAFSCERQG